MLTGLRNRPVCWSGLNQLDGVAHSSEVKRLGPRRGCWLFRPGLTSSLGCHVSRLHEHAQANDIRLPCHRATRCRLPKSCLVQPSTPALEPARTSKTCYQPSHVATLRATKAWIDRNNVKRQDFVRTSSNENHFTQEMPR